MAGHLVLAGGGHAHMTTLRDLREFTERGHRVTLVSGDCHHYYSGMGPGMLAGFYRPQDVRFNVQAMAERAGGRFVKAMVERIDADRRIVGLSTGEEIGYDVLSLNVGSEIPTDKAGDGGPDVAPVKPIAGLLWARERLAGMARRGAGRILVVGGGPAGLEIAGAAWRAFRDAVNGAPDCVGCGGRLEITVVAGSRFLPGLPEKARAIARASLGRRGVAVLEGRRAVKLGDGQAFLDDGRTLHYDLAFLATGVRPPRLMRDSGLPVSEDGGMLVDANLQCVGRPSIFGGGDCIHFEEQPLAKVGVYAVRQNSVLKRNLLAALEGREPEPFKPGGDYLLVYNLGDGTGLLVRSVLGRKIVFDGWSAWKIKDWIDRRFMESFQVSGERAEPS